ncbi:hypothetical protein FS837_002109 [Tulasnella sp. UAMH 9824]|nr:hypothetical protein FS837_002109 [Tulasnella sp. UAMH 9824]
MFAKLFTSRAAPTAPSAPAEHAPSRKTINQEGPNASVFARTLNKLKLSLTHPRSDDKSTQLQSETLTNTIVPIQASAPAPQDLPNPPQDRAHRSPPSLRRSHAIRRPPSQARSHHTSKSRGQRPSAPANPGSGKGSTAPRPSPRERTTAPSSHVRTPQAGNFNLDRSLATAAQQLRVEVVRPTGVDSTSPEPSPKPAAAPVKTHQEQREVRDERPRSWDSQFESEMARQRYSATEEDIEKLAEEGDLDEPPESLLQFWKKSRTHIDRKLSWDPTWEPEMHQLRHSVTSEDLRRLDVIRRKTPWLQAKPPKSPKAERTFKWFGGKKKGGRGRPEGLRFY